MPWTILAPLLITVLVLIEEVSCQSGGINSCVDYTVTMKQYGTTYDHDVQVECKAEANPGFEILLTNIGATSDNMTTYNDVYSNTTNIHFVRRNVVTPAYAAKVTTEFKGNRIILLTLKSVTRADELAMKYWMCGMSAPGCNRMNYAHLTLHGMVDALFRIAFLLVNGAEIAYNYNVPRGTESVTLTCVSISNPEPEKIEIIGVKNLIEYDDFACSRDSVQAFLWRCGRSGLMRFTRPGLTSVWCRVTWQKQTEYSETYELTLKVSMPRPTYSIISPSPSSSFSSPSPGFTTPTTTAAAQKPAEGDSGGASNTFCWGMLLTCITFAYTSIQCHSLYIFSGLPTDN